MEVLVKVCVLLEGVPPFRGLRGTCRRASPPPLQASHWTYTSPKDEQLRLDATEMGVGSSRVRAPLQMTRGRCARVHEYVAKRHRSTYALPRSHRCGAQVRAGANWEHGSWNSVPQYHNSGTIVIVEDSLQHKVYRRFLQTGCLQHVDDNAEEQLHLQHGLNLK